MNTPTLISVPSNPDLVSPLSTNCTSGTPCSWCTASVKSCRSSNPSCASTNSSTSCNTTTCITPSNHGNISHSKPLSAIKPTITKTSSPQSSCPQSCPASPPLLSLNKRSNPWKVQVNVDTPSTPLQQPIQSKAPPATPSFSQQPQQQLDDNINTKQDNKTALESGHLQVALSSSLSSPIKQPKSFRDIMLEEEQSQLFEKQQQRQNEKCEEQIVTKNQQIKQQQQHHQQQQDMYNISNNVNYCNKPKKYYNNNGYGKHYHNNTNNGYQGRLQHQHQYYNINSPSYHYYHRRHQGGGGYMSNNGQKKKQHNHEQQYHHNQSYHRRSSNNSSNNNHYYNKRHSHYSKQQNYYDYDGSKPFHHNQQQHHGQQQHSRSESGNDDAGCLMSSLSCMSLSKESNNHYPKSNSLIHGHDMNHTMTYTMMSCEDYQAITSTSRSKNNETKILQQTYKSNLSKSERQSIISLDCEMVGVGPSGERSALARVCVINFDYEVLLDTFVKVDEPVTDYRTFVSGIQPKDIQKDSSAMDFCTCRKIVLRLLKNKILVGHGLENDLAALKLCHPLGMIRDTAMYPPYMTATLVSPMERRRSCSIATTVSTSPSVIESDCSSTASTSSSFSSYGLDSIYLNNISVSCQGSGNISNGPLMQLKPRKLKEIAMEWLGISIQKCGEEHSPFEDACAALSLYKVDRGRWEMFMMM